MTCPICCRTCQPIQTLMAGLVLALCAGKAARAETPPRPAPDTTLGFLHFTAPDGWTAVDQPSKDCRAYQSPDSNQAETAHIFVFLTPQAKNGTDPFTALQQAINEGPARGTISKTFREGAVDAQDEQGYDIQTRRMEIDDGAGRHLTVAAYAVSVDGRLAVFWYGATGYPLFYKHLGVLKGIWGTRGARH